MGPWASGYLSYPGTSGYGILTLGLASLGVLAIWRWSASRSSVALALAQGAGSVSVVISIYAVYDVVYDVYVDAGDTWIDHIGWGVGLTAVGGLSLTLLCLVQYRRDRVADSRSLTLPRLGFSVSAVAVGAIGVGVAWGIASDDATPEWRWYADGPGRPIPEYALKIASGRTQSTTWGVWLFGYGEEELCLGTRSVADEFPQNEGEIGDLEEVSCGTEVPPRYWERVVEVPVGSRSIGKALLVFLTRSDVARLDVRTGRDRETKLTRIDVREISNEGRARPTYGDHLATPRL